MRGAALQHANIAPLDSEGNGEHEVTLGVRVGPSVEIPLEERVSGWMT